MAKLTISPDDVTDFKTPLYREDEQTKKVFRLLPETAADQVRLANGQNVEAKIGTLDSEIASVQETATTALNNANAAITTAGTANANATAAQQTAGTALAEGNEAKSLAQTAQQTANGKADKTLATQSDNGLMAAADKAKLDGIEAGAQVNPTLAELGGVAKTGGTMTGPLAVQTVKTYALSVRAEHLDREIAPATQAGTDLVFYDKNDKRLGLVGATLAPDGRHRFDLFCFGNDDAKLNYLNVIVEADGTPLVAHPTPPMSTTSTGISATIGYVNAKLGAGASVAALATLDEGAEEYVETLETKKLKAVAQVNAEAQQAIYAGFPYEIDGEEYFISYSLFDQQNLSDLAIAALGDPAGRFSLPCMSGDGQRVWLSLGAATICDLQRFALVGFRQAILQAADDKKVRIMAAVDEDELHEIVME